MRIFLFVLLLLPMLELWLMIEIGSEIGALAVIIWLIAMIFTGINLLRYLGASSMLRAAQSVRSGGVMPAQTLLDGLFKAVGAVLLIIPGFITDLMALLCFIPLVRGMLLKHWLAKIVTSARGKGMSAAEFGAASFKPGSFTSSKGNVYEHQEGSPTEVVNPASGALIDEQPESSTSKSAKPD